MDAQNFTDISLLSTISRTRRSFPVVISLIGPIAVQINKMSMYPRLMMAALVIWSQAESFPRKREGTMLIHLPETLRARWFEESTHVCPIVRNESRSPQWCGACGVGKAQSEKASSIVLRLSRLRHRQAVP